MWILFGNKLTTVRVPGGKSVERHCSACNETAMFYERSVSTKLSLYFIELLEYGKRRMMACGACGELYATDELGAPAEQHVVEKAFQSAEHAGSQISAGVKTAAGKLAAAAKTGMRDLGLTGDDGDAAPVGRSTEEQLSSYEDPLTSDEEDMEAKFRDLEKKYRIGG